MSGKKKRTISLKLSEAHLAFLESKGGKTKAIESLIEEAQSAKSSKKKLGIETIFWNSIITPDDPHLQETYRGIVITYLMNGKNLGTIDYFLPILIGRTGFDQKTLSKHLRKLSGAHYIHWQQLQLRPTIRLCEGVNSEEFIDTLLKFQSFLKEENEYVDILSLGTKEGGK